MRKIIPIITIILLITTQVTAQKKFDSAKDTIQIDQLVITGTHISSPASTIPASISVVPREVIERSNESSILSILSGYVPGLFVTERGTTGYGVYSGSAGGITMRGVGASPTTQVLITIDGHPQFMGINGHHLPDAYRASDAERIEVIRGPASTIYGSNAMGGVINIITRKPTDGVRTDIEASYGSYNTQKYMLSNGIKQGKFSSFVSLSHDRTDGHRDFSNFHQTNGNIKLGYDISKHLKISGDVALSKYLSTDPGTIEKPATTDTMTADVTRLSSSIALENSYKKTSGAVRLFYNYGDHDLYYGWRSYDHNFGVMAYQSMNLFEGNRITLGIDIKRYGGMATDRSKPKFALDKYINETAGYIIVEQVLAKKLTLNAGLRLENNSNYGNEYVPQAGISYRVTNSSTVKLSVAKGFRSPTIREMYVFAPNDSLRPEKMINYELSYNYVSPNSKFRGEAAAYISDGSNIIETEFVNGIPKYSRNSGSFLNKGFELSASYVLSKSLNFSANYSFLDMKKAILGSPRQQVNVVGNYSIGKFRFTANMQYINGLYISTGAKPIKDNFLLLNLTADYRVAKWINLYVKADNITDSDYSYSLGYPMPGATVTGGIKLRF